MNSSSRSLSVISQYVSGISSTILCNLSACLISSSLRHMRSASAFENRLSGESLPIVPALYARLTSAILALSVSLFFIAIIRSHASSSVSLFAFFFDEAFASESLFTCEGLRMFSDNLTSLFMHVHPFVIFDYVVNIVVRPTSKAVYIAVVCASHFVIGSVTFVDSFGAVVAIGSVVKWHRHNLSTRDSTGETNVRLLPNVPTPPINI